MSKSHDDSKEVERPIVAKTPVDLQRLKLMKLMKNPDKLIQLPERPKSKNTPAVPEFVRNVMGSSAGAGSGEFHVYRHLRRKEYARQKFIHEKSKKELLDEAYQQKIENNKLLAVQKTLKKRDKRLKKKQKNKLNKALKNNIAKDNTVQNDNHQPSDSSEEDEIIEKKEIESECQNDVQNDHNHEDKINVDEQGADE